MSKHQKATSQDVANLAGVSQASVSRAFTSGACIATKTRLKIENAANKLGYRPNALARSLSKNQSQLVGLVFANWGHPKAADILKGLSESLLEQGYKAVIQSVNKHRHVDTAIRDLLQYQVDGIIVFSAAPTPAMSAECVRNRVPVVLLNNAASGLATSSVVIDAVDTGRQIALAMAQRCYSRIALISADPSSQTVIDINDSILKSVADSSSAMVISQSSGVHGYDAGFAAMRELWNQPVSPDCVVCTSDYTALGVLAACRHELGVDVPDQVGIIGLGDIPIAAWKDNNLTTVKIPHDDLVAKSVEVLIAQIKGAPIGAQLQPFSADIIFRGTTRNI